MGDKRVINFVQAVNEAMRQCMSADPDVFIIGLGAPDPKGIFGTTSGLSEAFPGRVMDMPVSENAMTGIAVGAAISGMRPVMTHQRADFVLMGMDQIVNSAAKWRYMYGGQKNVPLTIRMFIGRGWGQGPQHSQNFQGLFAQIPGLKVVCPTTPYEAKGLLTASVMDPDPVIFIEHRWLSSQIGEVPEEPYELPIGKASVLRSGKHLTVVASMDMAVEAMIVAAKAAKQGIDAEVVNLNTIKPLDETTILRSVKKTGRLLVLDTSWKLFGVGAEVAAMVAEKGFEYLKRPVIRLGLPDAPTPTSPALANLYYPSHAEIGRAMATLAGKKLDTKKAGLEELVNDAPNDQFRGPF